MSSKKKKHFTAPLKNHYFLLTVLEISSISTEYPKTSPTSLILPFTVILSPLESSATTFFCSSFLIYACIPVNTKSSPIGLTVT